MRKLASYLFLLFFMSLSFAFSSCGGDDSDDSLDTPDEGKSTEVKNNKLPTGYYDCGNLKEDVYIYLRDFVQAGDVDGLNGTAFDWDNHFTSVVAFRVVDGSHIHSIIGGAMKTRNNYCYDQVTYSEPGFGTHTMYLYYKYPFIKYTYTFDGSVISMTDDGGYKITLYYKDGIITDQRVNYVKNDYKGEPMFKD
jgi:hypothetical protein